MEELLNKLIAIIEAEMNQQTLSEYDRAIIYEELATRLDQLAAALDYDTTDMFGN